MLFSLPSIAYSVTMRIFGTLLAIVLASCAPNNAPKAASAAPFSTIKWSDLVGAPFTLTSLAVKTQKIALPATRRPTIQFAEKNRVSGSAGVNLYAVEGAVSGKDDLSWSGPAAATKMAGPPEAMALEDSFLEALQAVTRIELRDGQLRLTSADGTTRMEFNR